MSQQAIKELLQVAERDEALLAKLAAADSASSVVKIGAELGYEFTDSELVTFSEQINFVSKSEEISDDELETISGGFTFSAGIVNYQVGVPSMGVMNPSAEKW